MRWVSELGGDRGVDGTGAQAGGRREQLGLVVCDGCVAERAVAMIGHTTVHGFTLQMLRGGGCRAAGAVAAAIHSPIHFQNSKRPCCRPPISNTTAVVRTFRILIVMEDFIVPVDSLNA